VVAKTKRYVEEVIVIDDGSTDMTAEVARAAGAVVISHERNRGKGAAIKTAMAQVDADILLFIDGDGQHDPEDIPKLLGPILRGEADFVIGSRYLKKSELYANPFQRKAANAVASLTISLIISIMQPIARTLSSYKLPQNTQASKLSSQKLAMITNVKIHKNSRIINKGFKWITDCTSGFIAMRKENCRYLQLLSNGFQIETEMIFEQAKNGFVIAETPISCIWGESTSRLSIMSDSVKTLKLLMNKLVHYSQQPNPTLNKTDIVNKI